MITVGDCLEVMRTMDAESVDSIVTDPPYGLGFMGKAWDHAVPGVPFWQEMLRVAKPGAFLAAFCGTRTDHRMKCAIEDAGWEIRDTIMWVYGSGFPKSHNGPWGGTALKPAWEPITLARKPLIGTVAANFERYGTGALNIDACRIVHETINGGNLADNPHLRGSKLRAAPVATSFGREGDETPLTSQLGRWPANLIHDGSDEVLAAFPNAPGQQRDTGPQFARNRGACYGEYAEVPLHAARGDSGSAARFFYCAKADRADRNDGCDGLPLRESGMVSNTSGQHMTRRDGGAPAPDANNHPTVKPTDLMRWLCRLVTPAGGLVLDPFAGSGSTGRGAIAEGFRFQGIELDPEYAAIAAARIRAMQPGLSFGAAA
ncbi:DNA methyltransferase [Lysobacter sp. F6437]|uniref:DNA methyltransferase n=1 Tax=Lysobacter sp. F6437 TaxID=3459296 RepID=UPI00403DD3FC